VIHDLSIRILVSWEETGVYLNASLLRARKTVKDISHPMVRPIVWLVEA
jgi:hypothetical protein